MTDEWKEEFWKTIIRAGLWIISLSLMFFAYVWVSDMTTPLLLGNEPPTIELLLVPPHIPPEPPM